MSNTFKLSLNNAAVTRCILGEGLYLNGSTAGWVDINSNRLFVDDSKGLTEFCIRNKPSVILQVFNNSVILGCDVGIVVFDTVTRREEVLRDALGNHDLGLYRSNDGGSYGNYSLLSFMHRHNPSDNAGYVYNITGDTWTLLDQSIAIPNTFIEIQRSKILISDSLNGQIWLFELDSSGSLEAKRLWAEIESGAAPDGGCMVGDFVLIALWDAAAIAVFSKNGDLIDKMAIPAIRPTNCKYDAKNSQLWVTSASEGLSESQLSEYPDSGNTFVFDLEFL
ncbi:SMP-30/gluconolactonase/LRE family protein [Gammaproteobacteria bacterium]|nr:SMP-30/gluconolactonase/LRE family protein [Gammaproteobacteria bacterium]